jgi:glycosyltransferase involved in cell wall biosynthesis
VSRKITVAIPFLNSSDYFYDAIRIPLFDDRVDEILVVDDKSNDDQYLALVDKVNSLLGGEKISFDPNSSLTVKENSHCLQSILATTLVEVSNQAQKIKIIRNQENLGAFANKYEAVKNSKNDWVFLLDSDNFLVECSIPSLYAVNFWDPNVCYCPSVLIMDRKKDTWRPWDNWNHRKFGYGPIGLKQIQNYIKLDKEFHEKYSCGLGVAGFLNTGNYFVHRDKYTSVLNLAIKDHINPRAADVIAFSYYWLTNHGNFQILPDLYYYHRLHESSFWIKNSKQSQVEADKYLDMINDA